MDAGDQLNQNLWVGILGWGYVKMSILKIVTCIITLSSRQRENKTPLSFFLWDNKNTRIWSTRGIGLDRRSRRLIWRLGSWKASCGPNVEVSRNWRTPLQQEYLLTQHLETALVILLQLSLLIHPGGALAQNESLRWWWSCLMYPWGPVKKAVDKGELKCELVAASHSGTDPVPTIFRSPCNFLISYRKQVTGDLCRVSCHKGASQEYHGTVWGSELEARSQDTCSLDVCLSFAFYFFFPTNLWFTFLMSQKDGGLSACCAWPWRIWLNKKTFSWTYTKL